MNQSFDFILVSHKKHESIFHRSQIKSFVFDLPDLPSSILSYKMIFFTGNTPRYLLTVTNIIFHRVSDKLHRSSCT